MLSFSIFLRYFLRENKKNQEANERVPTLKRKVGSHERIRCRESRRMRKLDKVCGRFLRDVDVEETDKELFVVQQTCSGSRRDSWRDVSVGGKLFNNVPTWASKMLPNDGKQINYTNECKKRLAFV